MFISYKKNQTGSILIIALWTLSFLSLLAGSMGLGVRQRITLLERLESREKIRGLAESGVRKAIALLNHDIGLAQAQFTAGAKAFRLNNEIEFGFINFRDGTAGVGYEYSDGPGYPPVKRSGMVDEESKINLNTTTEPVLRSLIQNVLNFNDTQAHDLALAIVNWREYTDGELKDLTGGSYYESLSDPYPSKKANFEMIDELLLVQGMDPGTFKRLLPYVTVYGEGKVNINTASRPVLMAMGLSDELADKILAVRWGEDVIESTMDDHIFQKTFDIASELKALIEISDEEAAAIDRLNQQQKLDTNSRYYSIRSEGRLNNSTSVATIHCVFNSQASKVEYWREE